MSKTNRNKRRWFYTVMLIVVCGLPVQGLKAQGDTLVFSLQEAMDYATENAYLSRSAGYDVEAKKKQVWEYLALGFPQVNLSGGLTDNLSLQENFISLEDEEGNVNLIKARFGSTYSWNVGGQVTQLIFDGSYILGVKASKIVVQLTEQMKQKTEIDVREVVAQAYFVALVAKRNYNVFNENLRVNEQTLKETNAFYKNGFREALDVDQIRLMVNNSKNMALEAERQLLVSESILKFAMGVDIDLPISLADDLDMLIVPVLSDLTEPNNFQVEKHIDYTISETQEDIQKVKVKNEKAQYLPKLNAFYDYTHYQMGEKFSEMNKTNGEMLGLSLSMPIMTSGRQNAIVQKEKLNLLKVQNEKEMMEQNLRREFLVASTNLTNARETFQNDKLGEDIARSIYDKTRIKFTNGLANSTELSQNEGQYIQSQIGYIQSTLNVLDAYIQYQKALGNL